MAAAPHTLTLDLDIERSACMPMEGQGVYARWDPERGELRMYSSTQTSTGVRAAVAAKLDLPLAKVECIAPDVGGGFGVKIVHPWPEEVLVPWAARLLGRPVKWTEDRREHFISAAHERGQLQQVTVGFDDEGRLLALDVQVLARQRRLHALRHHRPDHHLDPAARALQAGRLPLRVLVALHEHRPRHALSRRRPAAGLLRDGAHHGRHRRRPRHRPRRGALAQLHPPERDALRPRPALPGRPAAEVRLRRLPRLASPSSRSWSAGTTSPTTARQAEAEGRKVGLGIGCYVEGTGVGPYEGGHIQIETSGRVNVSTGLTSQGQGHETVFAQIVAAGARRAAWRTSTSPPATPARWRMPWAPSRRAPRS